MRRFLVVIATAAFACGGGGNGSTSGSTSGSTGSPDGGAPASGDAGSAPTADAGSPPETDAGTPVDAGGGTTADGGTTAGGAIDGGIADGGTAGGGSTDGGTGASACDGLVPATPAAPLQVQLTDQDLVDGACAPAVVDGTGHIAAVWENAFQPHQNDFTFFDATGGAVGTYEGVNTVLIGQASGFEGSDCRGAMCQEDIFVLGPTGNQLFATTPSDTSNGITANDPTGGILHTRVSNSTTSTLVLVDSIDADGTTRWTRTVADSFPPGAPAPMIAAVDRAGNALVLWQSTARFGSNTWAGQWFDPAGEAGTVFLALNGQTPGALFERTSSGLFLSSDQHGGSVWLGQFDAMATTLAPPPSWLAARPDKTLHMVHGGAGYAVIPPARASGLCQQQIEIVAPSGESCGTATFAVDGGTCTTNSIIVGYDGTVVQQLPEEREAACTAAGHQCNCTYRAWSGFFR